MEAHPREHQPWHPVERKQPVRGPPRTIISNNGVQIESNLNPQAKEFYPSYIVQQKKLIKIQEEWSLFDSIARKPIHQLNMNPHPVSWRSQDMRRIKETSGPVSKVIIAKPPPIIVAVKEDKWQLPEKLAVVVMEQKKGTATIEEQAEQVCDDKQLIEKPQLSEDIKKICQKNICDEPEILEHKELRLQDAVVQESLKIINEIKPENKLELEKESASAEVQPKNELVKESAPDEVKAVRVEHDIQSSDSDENFERAEEKRNDDLLALEEEILQKFTAMLSDEDSGEMSDEESTEESVPTLDEFNERMMNNDMDQLEAIRLCSEEVVHSVGDAGGVRHAGGQQKRDMDSDQILIHINQINYSQIEIKPSDSLGNLSGKVPPTTPTEELMHSPMEFRKIAKLFEKYKSPHKEEKKKSEKKSSVKKLSQAFYGGRSSTNATPTAKEKTPNRPATSSTSVVSRTKRFSASLQNFASSLKQRSTDVRKSTATTRLLQRSITPPSKSPVAKRTIRSRLSKSMSKQAATTGKKDSPPKQKDNARAVNTSADRRSPPRASGTRRSRPISFKALAQSLRIAERSKKNHTTYATTADANPVAAAAALSLTTPTALPKMPRDTLASAMRHVEVQRAPQRRNIFPNGDPDHNIDLPPYMLK